MPPKQKKVEVDLKLVRLREFVRDHQEVLSARRATTLVSTLRQKSSNVERKWYMLLKRKSAVFTPDQSDHLQQTFALLRSPDPTGLAGVQLSSNTVTMDAATTSSVHPSIIAVRPNNEDNSEDIDDDAYSCSSNHGNTHYAAGANMQPDSKRSRTIDVHDNSETAQTTLSQ